MHTSRLSVQETSLQPEDESTTSHRIPQPNSCLSYAPCVQAQLRFAAAPYSTSLLKSAYQTTSSDG